MSDLSIDVSIRYISSVSGSNAYEVYDLGQTSGVSFQQLLTIASGPFLHTGLVEVTQVPKELSHKPEEECERAHSHTFLIR